MRAAVRDRFGPPEVLRLEESDPPVPEGNQVTVRVLAASVNTADLEHLRGVPRVVRPYYGLRRPRRRGLGVDVAGRVEAVGPEVSHLRPGDEVWGDLTAYGLGAFADVVCAPEQAFAPKPAGLTFAQAACVPQAGLLALQGLRRRPVRAGDRVLVNGAGGSVGPFAVQLAKHAGAEVTGVDVADRLDLVRSAGADHVLDHTREDFTRVDRRYHTILDMAAHRPMRHYRRALTDDGAYVVVGGSLVRYAQALVYTGLTARRSRRIDFLRWQPNDAGDLAQLGGLLEAGDLEVVIDRTFPLTEVVQALRHQEEGRARGKVLVIP